MLALTAYLEFEIMATITVRNVPDEVHRAIRIRAAMHGLSAEAEIRSILEKAVNPDNRIKLGSLLVEIGRELEGIELDITRNQTPAKLVSFE